MKFMKKILLAIFISSLATVNVKCGGDKDNALISNLKKLYYGTPEQFKKFKGSLQDKDCSTVKALLKYPVNKDGFPQVAKCFFCNDLSQPVTYKHQLMGALIFYLLPAGVTAGALVLIYKLMKKIFGKSKKDNSKTKNSKEMENDPVIADDSEELYFNKSSESLSPEMQKKMASRKMLKKLMNEVAELEY